VTTKPISAEECADAFKREKREEGSRTTGCTVINDDVPVSVVKYRLAIYIKDGYTTNLGL
jgi:hypothetical protein